MNTELAPMNPFGQAAKVAPLQNNALAESDAQRSIAEVQAAMVIAKKFPRDPVEAMDRILQACSRPTLAESAIYAYPRGGQTVEGPSIRLAEALAQEWGNVQFGIRELSQESGTSTVEAFAWDVQTNTRSTKVFQVAHKRMARGQVKTLTDPRDIYEMVANQGARRLRACLLAVIPGDVVEQAQRQCALTMQENVSVDEQSIAKLTEAFAEFKVTPAMISHRLGGKHLSAMIAAEMTQLRKIYRSLKDGMAKPGDFFKTPENEQDEAAANLESQLQSQGADTTDAPQSDAEKPMPFDMLMDMIREADADELTQCEDFANAWDGRTKEGKKLAAAIDGRRIEIEAETASNP